MKRIIKSSKPQFILMIGDEGSFFIPHNVGGDRAPFFIAEGDKHAQEKVFAALEKNPRTSLTLFADTLAQDFRRETVPRLNLLDRPKLIARRLKQAFPQAGISASLNLKHDKTQVLLTGMHGDNPVFKWLERIREHQPHRAPPIALLPMECADLVIKLLPETKNGWGLLLSRQGTGGFRQIVTHNGELIFTRLTPPLPPLASAQDMAEVIIRDIRASLGYLGRFGLTDAAQLQAVLLTAADTHDALRGAGLPVQAKLMTPYQVAWDLELPFTPTKDEAYADLLYAGWLAQKGKARLPLMPRDIREARRTAQVRQWGWRVAVAALLAAFVITAWQTGDLFTTILDARQEATTLTTDQQKLANEQASAGSVTEPLSRLRQAVERRRLFSEPITMPWQALGALGQGLGDEARLVKLDWQSDKPSDENVQVDVKLTQAKAMSLADKRIIAAKFQTLAQNVTHAMPGYDVKLAHYPFPALPDEALSNEIKNDKADDTAQLIITRDLK